MSAIEAVLSGKISLVQTVAGSIDQQGALSGALSLDVENMLPVYRGAYEVTPGDQPQVLETENTTLLQNVVIGPIPSCYGKITWNGSFLTVS